MEWRRHDEYCLLSDDGRHAIAATHDPVMVVYLASRIPVGKSRFVDAKLIGVRRVRQDDHDARRAAITELKQVCETI